MTKKTRILLLTGILLLASVAVTAWTVRSKEKKEEYSLKVIRTEQGWAYVIYHHRKPFIYQDALPCLSGHEPFLSGKMALETGKLVLEKIRSGKNPSLCRSEIDMIRKTN